MYFTEFDKMFTVFVIAIALVSSILTLVIYFGIPIIWNLIKPWLHTITA